MTTPDLGLFRGELTAWLDGPYGPPRPVPGASLDAEVEHYRAVKRTLWDADWGRHGWPEAVGGLGTEPILRAIVAEEVALRGLTDPGAWSMIEVLAPTVIDTASPELAAQVVEPFLRGDELWCQGFSEPDAGSDLASLACRAVPTEGGWLVSGQKVWTSYAQYATRCVLLTRTGTPESRHRGITALFIDVDSPGIELRPIETQHGRPEFAEVFFDDVFVPAHRVLGQVDGGWKIAMDILPFERSTTFWHRGAHLHRRFDDLLTAVGDDRSSAADLGAAFSSLIAFRSRSRDTQRRIADGHPLGPETSIDKVLIANAEQQLFDAVRTALPGMLEFDEGPDADAWRADHQYSRAATIYGGTAEVQRNIIAGRLLDLGPEG